MKVWSVSKTSVDAHAEGLGLGAVEVDEHLGDGTAGSW